MDWEFDGEGGLEENIYFGGGCDADERVENKCGGLDGKFNHDYSGDWELDLTFSANLLDTGPPKLLSTLKPTFIFPGSFFLAVVPEQNQITLLMLIEA